MTDIAPTITRQAIAIEGRSAPGKVTGRLKVAIDAMVWQGSRRAQASKTAGIEEHSLRCALSKPHVKAYYLSQLQVLRDSERARNIHRLAEVRDQDSNKMAIVQAVRTLEDIADASDQPRRHQQQAVAGLTVVVLNTGRAADTPSAVIDGQAVDITTEP